MKHFYLAIILSIVALAICGTIAFGQAPVAPNPVPNVGIIIEPIQGQGGLMFKFTNSTDIDLGILYGKNQFILKPGKTHSIPIPQQKFIDLKIFEKRPRGQLVIGYSSKARPNDQKHFISLPWAKPNKQEEAQQDAP